MYVAALALTDFRSYEHVVVDLDPGVTTFIGPNGQGKTNLVEAIGYLATLGSHRVATDLPLVRRGKKRATVAARVVEGDRSRTVEVDINVGTANKARINQSPIPRVRDILGIIRVVVFAPEDIDLVRGDPSGRRRFLDDIVVQLTPRMAGVATDYERVLRQRSALLKSAGALRGAARTAALGTLEVWNDKLADAGAQIVVARARTVAGLRPHVEARYEQVSGTTDGADIRYESTVADVTLDDDAVPAVRERILAQMAEVQTKELDRGVCLVGPHRDDLVIELGGYPARGYVSHGESWSLALALRLASAEVLAVDDNRPILILDDVFAELDSGRRRRLAELIGTAPQVLITVAVEEDVPVDLAGSRFAVADGTVERV